MRTTFIALAALSALGACGDTQPEANAGQSATNQSGPDPVQQQVQAMPEGQRNAVLIRAIRDAGLQCQNVTGSEAQPAAGDGSPVWLARCEGGPGYIVAIGRGGIANVVPAAAGSQ